MSIIFRIPDKHIRSPLPSQRNWNTVYSGGGGNILQVVQTPQTSNNICFSNAVSSWMGNLYLISELPAVGSVYIGDGGNDM